MIAVRKATRTSITLIVFIACIVALSYWCNTLSASLFIKLNSLLSSRAHLGLVHRIVVTIAFWGLLIAATLDAILRGASGFGIINSYSIPITFSVCLLIWGLIDLSAGMSVRWFWLSYYLLLLICLKLSFNKLSQIKGAGPSKLKLFFKTPPKSNFTDISTVDKYTLYCFKSVLLVIWAALLVSFIVYCIENQSMFQYFK